MILKSIRTAAIAALIATPALAQDVPLNTLNGAGGTAQVDGQGELLLSGGLASGAIALVVAVLVIAAAAGDDDNTTTSSP